jgi:hypothetical protein
MARQNEIAAFTPEQARLLWQDYQERKQLQPQLQQNFPRRRPIDEPSPHRVFVRNDTEETIPPFACMQVTGTDEAAGRTVVTVVKPTITDGEYLINSQFEIKATSETESGVGWAYRFGVVVFLGDPPTEPTQYVPVVGSWEIEEGDGPFIVYGPHSVVEGALIGRFASKGGDGGVIEYTIISLTTKEAGPYTGLKAASALIHGAPCGRGNLIGTTVEVIDHSGGLFDASGSMAGYTGWASEMVFLSLDAEDECDTKTPCHWAAINRVCEPDTGVYAEPCGDDEEEEPEEPEPEEPGDPEGPLEELE